MTDFAGNLLPFLGNTFLSFMYLASMADDASVSEVEA